MKRILNFLFIAVMLFSFIPAGAGTTDSQGMPIFYLRGDFRSSGWSVQPDFRFTRNGNEYTLTVNAKNSIGECKFKISNDDWTINYGADVNVDSSMYVDGISDGPNMHTSGWNDAVISFTYNEENNYSAKIKFLLNGDDDIKDPPVKGLSGTLPVLYINVYTDERKTAYNNEVISKDLAHKNYFEFADYWLDVNGCEWLEELGAKSIGSKEEPLPLQIKARGNWTRIGFSKKPFKLKLDKKQSLLGLSKSKHFAILAHADDNMGYLRNFVGFNLGQRIGLPWTPSQQPVEVVINGDYRGLYFLTESIRVDEDRVNIVELGDNVEEGKLVSGGYIVELDNYDEDYGSQIQMDEQSCASGWHYLDKLRITFDTPEEYSDIQRHFITDQFTTMNNYVGNNSDELWKYVDLDDAARYYLVEEIVSHVESFHGSTYLFRDYGDGQKWHFSPLWDFGNAFNGSTTDFLYNCDPFGNTWIPSLRENRTFNEKVKATWLWFMQNEYPGLEDDIDEYVTHLKAAAYADFDRWNGKSIPAGGQSVADNRDMVGKRDNVINHLNGKIAWLKTQFGDYNRGHNIEPERDTTPAAELPNYVATGVGSVEDIVISNDAVFYNLQGTRIKNPEAGKIYIIVQGGKSYKAILK